MKKTYTSFILTALLISFSAALLAQPNTWNGGPTDGIDVGGNWTSGLPTSSGNVGIFNSDAFWHDTPPAGGAEVNLTDYYLDIQSGTLSNGGVANIYSFTGGEITVSGGAIDSGDQIKLLNDAVLTLTSGSINTNTEDLFLRNAGATYLQSGGTLTTSFAEVRNATASFTMNGGTINSSGALTVVDGLTSFNGGDSNFSGNLVLSGEANLSFGGTTSGTVDFGGYTDSSIGDLQQFDWLSGSLMQLNIVGADSAFYEGLWDDGYLTVDNAQTGTFGSNFNVSGETLALIPEPSSLALLALAGLAALFLRRRQ